MKIIFKSIICIGLAVLAFLVFTLQAQSPDGKKYTDRHIGIQFVYPENLEIYKPKEIQLRECERCPTAIHVRVEETDETYESLKELVKKGDEEFFEERIIDGVQALVLRAEDHMSVYAVKNNELYTIRIRFVDYEKFLETIRFI